MTRRAGCGVVSPKNKSSPSSPKREFVLPGPFDSGPSHTNRHGLPFEEWERDFLRRIVDRLPQGKRPPLRVLGETLGRTGEAVKTQLYKMGYTLSEGRITMVQDSDEERMARWRQEVADEQE